MYRTAAADLVRRAQSDALVAMTTLQGVTQQVLPANLATLRGAIAAARQVQAEHPDLVDDAEVEEWEQFASNVQGVLVEPTVAEALRSLGAM